MNTLDTNTPRISIPYASVHHAIMYLYILLILCIYIYHVHAIYIMYTYIYHYSPIHQYVYQEHMYPTYLSRVANIPNT